MLTLSDSFILNTEYMPNTDPINTETNYREFV